jgi:hypothetical protein
MPKHLAVIIVITLSIIALIGPSGVHAAGLVPCDGPDCNLDSLILLAQNVIDFLIFKIAAPLAAVSFAVAGFIYITAQGNESQHQKAKSIFVSVFIGFVIALSAWIVVKFIVTALVDPSVFDPSQYLSS